LFQIVVAAVLELGHDRLLSHLFVKWSLITSPLNSESVTFGVVK
jgi:hypothetical protein